MGETTLRGCVCERCGHPWLPRSPKHPIICPKCKSPYWDRPKKALAGQKEE